MGTRILLIDPDTEHTDWLWRSLEPIHWTVTMVDTAAESLAEMDTPVDCIVTELTLPDHPGGLMWVAALLKRKPPYTPLMVCSAADDQQTRVLALKMGADDVLSKPFDLDLFTAKVDVLVNNTRLREAYARERGELISPRPVIVGPLEIRQYEAWIDGQKLKLTPTEFRLLKAIAESFPEGITLDECLDKIWGSNYASDSYRDALMTHKWRVDQKVRPWFGVALDRGVKSRYRLEYLDHDSPDL